MPRSDDGLGELHRSSLHFFWIADCSGSMEGSKIQSLNQAIRECLPELRDSQANNPYARMYLRALAFSDGARWHSSQATPVEDFEWTDLEAGGLTDLGAALRLLSSEMVPERIGRRALPPVLVLLSDGQPTDAWQPELERFDASGWGRPGRSVRVAIAIGDDADIDVLSRFTGNAEMVLRAQNAQELKRLIRWASVELSRTASSGRSMVGADVAPGNALHIPMPQAAAAVDDDTW